MNETPNLLLADHLKKLKLPTVLREYDKQARQPPVSGKLSAALFISNFQGGEIGQ